jgi:hypothetical protein
MEGFTAVSRVREESGEDTRYGGWRERKGDDQVAGEKKSMRNDLNNIIH